MLASKKHISRVIAGGMTLAALSFIILLISVCNSRKDISFLEQHAGAEWILYAKPSESQLLLLSEISGEFHHTLVLKNLPAKATLSLRALTRWSLAINGDIIATSAPNTNWKQPTTLDVASRLHPGTNEIRVTVLNSNGPPALWLTLDAGEIKLASGPNWNASLMGAVETKAAISGAPVTFADGNPLSGGEQPLPSLRQHVGTFVEFAILSAILVFGTKRWLKKRQAREGIIESLDSPRNTWTIIAIPLLLWAMLFFNNVGQLPIRAGYDGTDHLTYINYIRTTGKLPLATDGWQMYQPPLYYLVSSLLLLPFSPGNFSSGAADMLRFFGYCTGAAQFILVFLSLRVLFPNRTGLAWFGLLLAAFLPESIYLSYFVTNESLAAALFSGAIYFCLRILKDEKYSPWLPVGLGLCLGASLLTKFTGIIGIPFFAAALWCRVFFKNENQSRVRFSSILLVFGIALLVCGWHYVRVWRHFGNPIIGNWDAASGYKWWMEEGCHTRSFLFRFGSSLVYPWFSGINGFADGLYSTLWGDGMWGGVVYIIDRPPWNYDLMAAGYLFALLPTALILAGTFAALRKFIRQPEPAWLLLLGVAFSMIAALVWMSLKLPSYGQVKAFYGLIAVIPLCAFGALGWDFILRRGKFVFAIAATLMGVWAINSYASFWIRSSDPETHLTLGRFLADSGAPNDAINQYTEAYRLAPNNPKVRNRLAVQLAGRDFAQSKLLFDANLKEAPNFAETHAVMSQFYAAQKKYDLAAIEARRAVELAPDQPFAYPPLCQLLTDAARYREAAHAGQLGLRVSPYSPELQYKTGIAFAHMNDATNAIAYFSRAVSLKPTWAEARNQLGLALLGIHQDQSAFEQLSQAVRLLPTNAVFHHHLGLALVALKKPAEAILEYRHALEANANFTPALNDLAWVLATDPDPKLRNGELAVELASRACDLTERKNANCLGTLAAAYAEAGKFSQAIAFANTAIELAKDADDSALIATNLKLIVFYRANRAYHSDPPLATLAR